jgi:class III poly(R)-hydroxyalkanoic acid synthase PhaE subunit
MNEPNDQAHDSTAPESLLETWLKMSVEFWQNAGNMWKTPSTFSESESSGDDGPKTRMEETLGSTLKAWQSMSNFMSEPEAMEAVTRGIHAFPEIMARALRPAWAAFFETQLQWMEKAAKFGESTVAYNFDNLDQEAFKAWREIYENELRRYLTMPQLGLTRQYQEKLAQTMDKFNMFQTTMAEFISVMYLPIEKSMKVMQDQLADLMEKGQLPQKQKEYYNIWIKTLEGHYMTLFKSPEYTTMLGNTLDKMGEYLASRRELLEDAMKSLPVASHKDLDELYKEMYQLKKRIKSLEKKARSKEATNQ